MFLPPPVLDAVASVAATATGLAETRADGAAAGATGFATLDWVVLLGLLLGTTWLGHRKAGRPTSARDFFLGGRSLPWWAVSASIVATEISAVTFVSLPSVVYRDGGNLTYLQIGLFGSLIARALVAFRLLPAYYEREIYSPYEYVERRLGRRGKGVTTALFTLGGVLGQSARVYLTALVLEVLLADELGALQAATGIAPLTGAVLAIGVVAVLWTWMGGIATVVWTDAVLFLLFLAGIGVSLAVLHGGLDGGLPAAFAAGADAGKFRLLDTSTDLARPYTLWVALFVASWGQVAPYGCDQLMVQRLFCCRSLRQAQAAVLTSIVAMGVTFAVALVGIGLWRWNLEHPLAAEAAALVAEKPDRVFPLFIANVLPAGLKGLVLAGAFAAAISSLDSILAALSQTTLGLLPAARDDRATLRRSRALVLAYGVLLCAAAVAVQHAARAYDSVLDLALAMAGYTGGALLAAFLLAFLPLRVNGSGLVLAAPLSVLAVLGVAWHEAWTLWAVAVGGGLLGLAFLAQSRRAGVALAGRRLGQLLLLTLGVLGCAALVRYGVVRWVVDGDTGARTPVSLPWPWYTAVGTLVALGFGWALDLGRLGGPWATPVQAAAADAPRA